MAEQIESDLKKIVPEEDENRHMVLSDGRKLYIRPIKMRKVARWTALFLKFASLAEVKDGKIDPNVQITPEYIGRVADVAPEIGDQFFDLMAPCLDGATPDDIDQDDAFEVIGRFVQLNLTQAFLGKALALAGGVRG